MSKKVWCELCHQYTEEIAFGVLECGHHEDDVNFEEDLYGEDPNPEQELDFED